MPKALECVATEPECALNSNISLILQDTRELGRFALVNAFEVVAYVPVDANDKCEARTNNSPNVDARRSRVLSLSALKRLRCLTGDPGSLVGCAAKKSCESGPSSMSSIVLKNGVHLVDNLGVLVVLGESSNTN